MSVRFGRAAPTIAVGDVERALGFYRDLLGMELTFTNGDPTGFAILQRDDAEVHLTLDPDHRATTNNVMHLMVSDVDALHATMVAAGVPIVRALRDLDVSLRAFVMADPDGNRIDAAEAR